MNTDQKIVLITGASRGIGAATAQLMARSGYMVAVNYHKNKEAAARVVEAIRSSGGKTVAIQADVSKEEDVLRLCQEAESLLGPLCPG